MAKRAKAAVESRDRLQAEIAEAEKGLERAQKEVERLSRRKAELVYRRDEDTSMLVDRELQYAVGTRHTLADIAAGGVVQFQPAGSELWLVLSRCDVTGLIVCAGLHSGLVERFECGLGTNPGVAYLGEGRVVVSTCKKR